MVLQPKPGPGRPKKSNPDPLDIANLHMDWDANHVIRDRLREGQQMLVGGQGEDIPTVVSNVDVLQPLIARMSLAPERPLPSIEHLRDEIERLYMKNKRGNTQEDMPNVVELSWRVRKLLVFTKMKVRRKEVSSVTLRHYRFECILLTTNSRSKIKITRYNILNFPFIGYGVAEQERAYLHWSDHNRPQINYITKVPEFQQICLELDSSLQVRGTMGGGMWWQPREFE